MASRKLKARVSAKKKAGSKAKRGPKAKKASKPAAKARRPRAAKLPEKARVVVRNPKIIEEKAVRAAMVAQAKADQAWRDEMFSWVKELKQIQDIVHRSSHENSQATCRNEVCLMIARRLKSRAFRAIERAAASGKKPGPAGKKTKTPKAKASKPTKVSKPRRGRAKRDPAPTEQLTPEEEAPAPAPEVVTFDNLSTDAA